MPDAMAFACGHAIHVEFRANALFVKNVGGSVEAEVDVEDAENKSSEDESEIKPKLSDFDVETRRPLQ